MRTDRARVLAELPLPLGPEAGVLDALQIAVAVEDACRVVLPEEHLTVAALRDRDRVLVLLDSLDETR